MEKAAGFLLLLGDESRASSTHSLGGKDGFILSTSLYVMYFLQSLFAKWPSHGYKEKMKMIMMQSHNPANFGISQQLYLTYWPKFTCNSIAVKSFEQRAGNAQLQMLFQFYSILRASLQMSPNEELNTNNDDLSFVQTIYIMMVTHN